MSTETFLRVGIDGTAAQTGERVIVRSLDNINNAANNAEMTWKQFVASNMSEQMKLTGSHAAAMSAMGAAWQKYKADVQSGTAASQEGAKVVKRSMQDISKSADVAGVSISTLENMFVRLAARTVMIGGIYGAIHLVTTGIREAIGAVNDFQVSVIQIAAGLTQIGVTNGAKDISKTYQESTKYANALVLKMQEIDPLTLANNKGLMAMLQVMTAQGVVLDINNKKQVSAFTDVSNTIATLTAGQDQQMQMYQETRSLLSGQVDMHSQVARILDAQMKQQGTSLKEQIALGRQNNDIWERLAPYMKGINAASGDIQKTWESVKTSFQTSLNIVQRAGFTTIVADMVMIVGSLNTYLKENASILGGDIKKAWLGVRDSIFTVEEGTKKITFNPALLEALKNLGTILSFVGQTILNVTSFLIKHSSAIMYTVAAYVTYKKALDILNYAAAQNIGYLGASTTAAVKKAQAMTLLDVTEKQLLSTQQSALVMANERLAHDAAIKTSNADSLSIQTAKNISTNAEMTTNIAATQAEITRLGVIQSLNVAKREELSATLPLLGLELQVANEERASAAAKLQKIEASYASVTAKKAEAMAARDALAAQQTQILSQEQNTMTGKQLLVVETELGLAKKSCAGYTGQAALQEGRLNATRAESLPLISGAATAERAYNSAINAVTASGMRSLAIKEQEILLQKTLLSQRLQVINVDNAAVVAANRHNQALLALGVSTDFVSATSLRKLQTDYLQSTETVRGTILLTAHTEALAMNAAMLNANTLGSRALVAASTLLNGALSLVGGWLGVVTLAIMAGVWAWDKWGTAANEAFKKAKQSKDEANDIVKSMQDQIDAYKAKQKLIDETKNGGIANNETELEAALANTNALSKYKKTQEEIAGLQRDIFIATNAAADGTLTNERKIRDSKQMIIQKEETLLSLARKAKELSDLNKVDTPKGTPGKPESTSPNYASQGKIDSAERAYDEALLSRKLAQIKNSITLQQGLLDDQHKRGLQSDQQYIKDSLTLQEKGFAEEIAQVQNQEKKLKQGKNDAYDLYKMGGAGKTDKERDKNTLTLYQAYLTAETAYVNEIKKEEGLQNKLAETRQKSGFAGVAASQAQAQAYADVTASLKDMQGATLEAVNIREKYKQGELDKQAAGIMANGPVVSGSMAQLLNIQKEIEISKANQTKATYAQDKVQGDLNAELLRQVGLTGDAVTLENSLVALDPARLGLNDTTKALQDMVNSLKEVSAQFDQLHRNDSIKFEIQDMGVDQYTKRERDIQREYDKTKDKKIEDLKKYEKAVMTHYKEITSINEDLNLNDQLKTARTTQLKKDMLQMYVQTAGGLMGELAGVMDQSNRSQFEAAKALNIGQAIMNTASAIMQAMANLPPPASYVAAAIAAATGAIQVAKIASTSYKGGGSVSNAAVSGSFGGSGGGSAVGASIGAPITSVQDRISQDAMRHLATSMDNASVAIGKVADGLTQIKDLFTSGQGGLAVKGAPNIFTQTGEATNGFMGSGSSLAEWSGFGKSTAAGAAIGSVVPVFGTILGAAIGTVIGTFSAMFGHGERKTESAGFRLGMNDGSLQGDTYSNWKEKGGWFSSDKKGTNYGTMDSSFQATIQKYVTQIEATVTRSAVALGTSANLAAVSLPMSNIQTSGRKPEDIAKDVEAWLQKVGDTMAKTVPELEKYALAGENAFDALVRLSTSLQGVNESLSLVGHTLISSTLDGANAAYKLQDAFGGLDKFTASVDKYFTTMFNSTEQAQMKQTASQRTLTVAINEMDATYTDLHWSVPKTREEFRSLVNSLDVTTEEGAALFQALMAVAPAMGDLIDSTQKLADVAKQYSDWSVRGLKATGKPEMVSIVETIISQEDELTAARKDGLDVSQLEMVQHQELLKALNDGMATAADNYTQAQDKFNQVIIDGATKLMTDAKSLATAWKSISDGLLKTQTSLKIGADSALSPEAQLAAARSTALNDYNKGMSGDQTAMGAFGTDTTSYLNLAKKYYASTTAYADEFALFNNLLGDATSQATRQVNYAEANAAAQQAIIDQLQKSEEQRAKDAQAAAALQMAQYKVLIDGFQKLLAEATIQSTSLTQLEADARRQAAGGTN